MLTAISWLFNLWPLDESDGLAIHRVCRVQADFIMPLELIVSLSNSSPLSSDGLKNFSIASPLVSYIIQQTASQSWLCFLILSLLSKLDATEGQHAPLHQPGLACSLRNISHAHVCAMYIWQNY